jgi:selenocysteine-specific elongation factor
VEPDWLNLVELEVRGLVEGTFLESSPIIRTSAKQGQGIEELKRAIHSECKRLTADHSESLVKQSHPFRMAIDRVFSIAGYGTVATGSVASGRLNVGEVVEILPSRTPARIRGLQTHESSVGSIHVGQRAALNLASIDLEDVERGYELAASGFLLPSDNLLVKLKVLDRANFPLKNRDRVRFHIGTAETMGLVNLFGATELLPGQESFAQVFLSDSCASVWGQPFVIRQPSPMETLGGGTILHSNPRKLKLNQLNETEKHLLYELTSNDLFKRASAAVYFASETNIQPMDLVRLADVADAAALLGKLKLANEVVEYPISASRQGVVHRLHLEMIANRVLEVLSRLHREHPLRFSHLRHELANEFNYLQHPVWLDLAIEMLNKKKQVESNVHRIALVGSGPQLSKSQRQLLEQLINQLKSSGLAAPSISDLKAATAKNKDDVEALLGLAAENGSIVRISDDLYLHSEILSQVQQTLTFALGNGIGLSTSDLRQVLDTTRKYAIPILEYLDKAGFTVRDGDLRKLARTR